MRIQLTKTNLSKTELETVDNNGLVLTWKKNTWSKYSTCTTEEIFNEINLYWKHKGKAFQNKLGELYKKAYDKFLSEWELTDLKSDISAICLEILDMHDFDEVHTFLTKKKLIHYKQLELNKTKEEYLEKGYPEEQSYTEDDYLKLATLATIFKAMAPIWGNFIKIVGAPKTTKTVGDNYKEMETLSLVTQSKLFETEAMAKLKRYSNVWAADKQKKSLSSVTMLMSSDDIPYYYISLSIVRRMMIQRFDAEVPPKSSLVANIWNYVFFTKGNSLVKGITQIQFTGSKNDGSDASEKNTIVDRVKNSQTVPDYIPVIHGEYFTTNDEAFFQHLISNTLKVKTKEESQALLLKLREKKAYMLELPSFITSTFHTTLVAKVLSDYIKVGVFKTLTQPAKISLIAVASVLLELRGFQDISTLICGTKKLYEKEELLISGYAFNSLDKAIAARLAEYYRYIPKLSEKAALINPGVSFIDKTIIEINSNKWDFKMDEIVDIKNSIAKLLLNEDNLA